MEKNLSDLESNGWNVGGENEGVQRGKYSCNGKGGSAKGPEFESSPQQSPLSWLGPVDTFPKLCCFSFANWMILSSLQNCKRD